MRKITLLSIALCTAYCLQAQDIRQYVLDNTVPLKSNHPDSTDFSDLHLIGKAIGDSRIVFIGEQGHGDAPAFLAKTRLIKWLHEEKNFNVLAFEGDFFGLNVGWDRLPKTKAISDSFLKNNLYPIWSRCDALENLLYAYIPQTQTTALPLRVTGFDNQLLLNYSSRNLAVKLDSLLRDLQLPVTNESNYLSEILPLIDSLTNGTLKNKGQYDVQLAGLLRIREQLATKLSKENFWMILVDNLISANYQYRNIHKQVESTNTRDRQMAANLLWLATTKYPGEKIIVWAHNTHISKYSGHFDNRFLNGHSWMGAEFDKIKGPIKTYTIGLTSYSGIEGNLGRAGTTAITPPAKNSFENWINESFNFAFVDFVKFNEINQTEVPTFAMKGQHHTFNLKAPWTKIFDGILFIRNIYPCKRMPTLTQ